nr:basic proline-rich protein-like [Meriones unguiculatus]
MPARSSDPTPRPGAQLENTLQITGVPAQACPLPLETLSHNHIPYSLQDKAEMTYGQAPPAMPGYTLCSWEKKEERKETADGLRVGRPSDQTRTSVKTSNKKLERSRCRRTRPSPPGTGRAPGPAEPRLRGKSRPPERGRVTRGAERPGDASAPHAPGQGRPRANRGAHPGRRAGPASSRAAGTTELRGTAREGTAPPSGGARPTRTPGSRPPPPPSPRGSSVPPSGGSGGLPLPAPSDTRPHAAPRRSPPPANPRLRRHPVHRPVDRERPGKPRGGRPAVPGPLHRGDPGGGGEAARGVSGAGRAAAARTVPPRDLPPSPPHASLPSSPAAAERACSRNAMESRRSERAQRGARHNGRGEPRGRPLPPAPGRAEGEATAAAARSLARPPARRGPPAHSPGTGVVGLGGAGPRRVRAPRHRSPRCSGTSSPPPPPRRPSPSAGHTRDPRRRRRRLRSGVSGGGGEAGARRGAAGLGPGTACGPTWAPRRPAARAHGRSAPRHAERRASPGRGAAPFRPGSGCGGRPPTPGLAGPGHSPGTVAALSGEAQVLRLEAAERGTRSPTLAPHARTRGACAPSSENGDKLRPPTRQRDPSGCRLPGLTGGVKPVPSPSPNFPGTPGGGG